MSANERTKRRIWVRCGGRCVICNKYLLFEHLEDGHAVRQIGEVAHIAGESLDGPRGTSKAPPDERNESENLVLLCPDDHRGADKKRLADPLYTEAFLLERKKLHEGFVEHSTGLRDLRRTAVLRVVGGVRGAAGNVSKEEAAAAVMRHGLRMPMHQPDPYGIGDQIDLQMLGDDVDEGYWATGLTIIDKGVSRLQRKIAEEGTDHISVFAIALLPLLVALGNRIDDTVNVDIFERYRSTESWAWNEDEAIVTFAAASHPTIADGTTDAVLVVNASGTVQVDELPAELRELPVFTIGPTNSVVPGPNTFENSGTIRSFQRAVRDFFASLESESKTKSIRRLHLIAAAPVSAAVAIGRCLPVDNAAPHLAVYHRSGHTYSHAFDLPHERHQDIT